MKYIMFVCTGNTCRSPMAEFILKKKLKDNEIKGIKVSSSGLRVKSGDEINGLAKIVLKENGISVRSFKPKQLDEESIGKQHIIICMTEQQKEALKSVSHAVCFYDLYGLNDVSDPYGMGIAEYRECYRQLDRACDCIIKELTEAKKIY